MNAAAAHIDSFDLVGRGGADRLIVAVADHEVVLHDAAERRQRQKMHHAGRAVLPLDVEHQAIAGDADMQGIRTAEVALRHEQVLLDQIVDRDRALMLDVRPRPPDRFLIERHRDHAVVGIVALRGLGHDRLSRNPTERE